MEKGKIYYRLAGDSDTDYDDWPTNINELIRWLKDMRDKAPPEFRNDVEFVIEHENGWYDERCSRSWRIGYAREETDAEATARMDAYRAESEREAALQLERERKNYEALKAKFEGTK